MQYGLVSEVSRMLAWLAHMALECCGSLGIEHGIHRGRFPAVFEVYFFRISFPLRVFSSRYSSP